MSDSSTKSLDSYDLYPTPSPYEMLGLDPDEAATTTTAEIVKAHKALVNKAKRGIKDPSERARRMDELNSARDLVLRPDDRVMIDFFALSKNPIAEICCSFAKRWTSEPLSTQEVLGAAINSVVDDLISDALAERSATPLHALTPPKLLEEPRAKSERLPLAHVEL